MTDPINPDQASSSQINDSIYTESMVRSSDGEPAVGLHWGDLSCQLSPDEARRHALGIIQAANAADLDAAVVKWAIEKLEQPPKNAVKLLRHIRDVRESPDGIPSCTINLGVESIRPATARERGFYLIANASNIELEASLALILVRDMGLDGEAVSMLIQELRDMRGLSSDWQQAGMGEPDEKSTGE